MKKLKLFALVAVGLMGLSGAANAETALLASDDFVGISFWLVSMVMLASTAFFFLEAGKCCSRLENINNCIWSSNWYCLCTLRVYERCMGYDW